MGKKEGYTQRQGVRRDGERVEEDKEERVSELPKSHGQLMKPLESDGEDFLQV